MRDHFSDHLGDEEKMVIIYPDSIASFVLTDDDIGERPVDCNIMLPAVLFPNFELGIIGNLVMERRPDNLLTIAIVMTFKIGVRNEYGN